ncbi:hypothetical protein FTV88_1425 [Heliorestis convoluta]|uniref:Uncharacterized protein n=1 Tax=Heliorestis convoluta TaxID=356322 RepID=A0A5Q2N2R1_9FIRM|nr:hypothetical protein FTV88_1425 [Heliorestis convoluta]
MTCFPNISAPLSDSILTRIENTRQGNLIAFSCIFVKKVHCREVGYGVN